MASGGEMNTENMRDKLTITDAAIIAIDSITTNKYLIVYTDNCDLTIHKNNQDLFFPQGTFVFIERGIKFSCKINKKIQKKNLIELYGLTKKN